MVIKRFVVMVFVAVIAAGCRRCLRIGISKTLATTSEDWLQRPAAVDDQKVETKYATLDLLSSPFAGVPGLICATVSDPF